MNIAREGTIVIQDWNLDFSEVCIPTPPGGWVARAATMSPAETKLYEKFKIQRDTQAAAMAVVKDMHLSANAETAEQRESLLSFIPALSPLYLTHSPRPQPIISEFLALTYPFLKSDSSAS